MTYLALVTVLLTAAAPGVPRTVVQAIPRSIDFMSDSQSHQIDLSIGSYSIRRDGLVGRSDGAAPQGRLPLDDGARIYTLYALAAGDDLVVFYEASDELENSGKLVRLEGRTLEVIWVATGPGMNITSPVPCADSLCLAGHGSVARVRVETGRVVWAHYDLYSSLRAFNSPRDLVVDKGKLFVHESLASYDHRPAKTLVVDVATGKYATK